MKGQVTVEFMIILILLFSLFGFALFVYSEQNKGLIHSKEAFNAKALAKKFGNSINAIYLINGNASTEILLEPGDFNYSIEGRNLRIHYRTNFFSNALMTNQVIVNTDSNETGKEVRIRKEDGVIFVEDV